MASPQPPTSLTGVLERIIFLNEENHYTIAELRPDGARNAEDRVTIVGLLPGVQCGETLSLGGEWTRHAQHGAQFKVTTYQSRLPSSVYGIRKYLGSGLVPGIGKVYANKIVDAFGTDTFRVLSEESGKLRQVPGIGKVRATAIKAAWEEQRTLREVHIFLQTYGVTTAQCVRIVKKLGPEAQAIVRQEPYRLAREIDGIGFKTADRIAINLGFANDAPPRLDAGVIYALQTLEEEGHTGFPRAELIAHAAQLLDTSADRIEARVDTLVSRHDLVEHLPPDPDSVDSPAVSRPSSQSTHAPSSSPPATSQVIPQSAARTPPTESGIPHSALRTPHSAIRIPHSALRTPPSFIQLPVHDRAEQRIAGALRRLASVPSALPAIKVEAAIKWAQEKASISFHELQESALRHALEHKVSILTGGPGTGKTTILRALVEILKAKKARVTLAAPTGRAAQRLTETTGGFASTIHRLLAYDPVGGGFVHNESKPISTDFLIVDEASMLDTRLAAALLSAIPSRAHLLLVGDTDQLPSVGAGNVLKDVIQVSREQLAVSSRATAGRNEREAGSRSQSSKPSSVTQSLPLPASRLPAPASGVSAPAHRSPLTAYPIPVTELRFIYRQTKESLIVTTAHAINGGEAQPPPVVGEVAKAQAWSDLNFIHATGADDCLAKVLELCTRFIPEHLSWLDPVADVQVLAPMHKGVVGVANLNQQLQAALRPFKGVARGDVARVSRPVMDRHIRHETSATPALKTVSGSYEVGDKLIQLRNNYDKGLFNGDIGTVAEVDAAKGTLVADFDGDRHTFERGEFGDVALAHAISIHKSQGSEYPCVIIPLLKAHFMMLQRNLIYTAITRGRKRVFLVGEPAAYGMAVRNAESRLRHTHLRAKIAGN